MTNDFNLESLFVAKTRQKLNKKTELILNEIRSKTC